MEGKHDCARSAAIGEWLPLAPTYFAAREGSLTGSTNSESRIPAQNQLIRRQ